MKVVIKSKFCCQSFPLNDMAIEVNEETLKEIGETKCFDVENNCVIDYDNLNDLKKQEKQNKIQELNEKLNKSDYIASKLAEAVSKYISTGDNTDVLLLREKYALELINREQWRNEIDKLQQELKLLDK